MDLFRIESTKHTPGIILDPENKTFEFYGFSLPEDAAGFYQPILEWINNYSNEMKLLQDHPGTLNVLFKLVYFNSSSLRYLVEIFQAIRTLVEIGVKVEINWHYDNEDPAIAESGRELGLASNLPVNIVPLY